MHLMWLNQSFQEVEGHTTYIGLAPLNRPFTIEAALPLQEILNFSSAICHLGKLVLLCGKPRESKVPLNICSMRKVKEDVGEKIKKNNCDPDHSFQLIILLTFLVNSVSVGYLRLGELLLCNTAWLCMDCQSPRESCIQAVALLESLFIQNSSQFRHRHLQQVNKEIQQQTWMI